MYRPIYVLITVKLCNYIKYYCSIKLNVFPDISKQGDFIFMKYIFFK